MQEIVLLVRYNLLLVLTIILFKTDVHSQIYPDERINFLLKSGISYIVNQDYAEAELFFNSLKKEFPQLPIGKIYLAANKIAQAYDYAEEFDEDFILKNLEEAKEQAEKLIESDNENIWYQYFHVLAEGYTAYFYAINESWFSALTTGVDAISGFEKISVLDENFYEAYIAIGTFEYWKGRKTEFLEWLPFNNDTKKIGIDMLIVAIESSSYNSYLAIHSLIWIYIDQKKYEDAIEISEKALVEFPNSRIFKWGMARAFEEINPSEAIRLYLEILNSYPVYTATNHKNEIILKHLIAQQYVKLGDKKRALKYCDDILSINSVPEKTVVELSDRLERVQLLRTELTQ